MVDRAVGTWVEAAVAADSPSGGPSPGDRPKKIYAHYMGCYPVAAAATAHHRANDAHKIRHDGTGQFDAIGDRWRNWPLVPDGMKLTLQESADLEIRRASAAGSTVSPLTPGPAARARKDVCDALFQVARDKDYPFEITICLDAGIQGERGSGRLRSSTSSTSTAAIPSSRAATASR